MKIKVLLVVPGRETEVKRIPGNLKFIKSFIGDELYSIRLNENTMLIGNKMLELMILTEYMEKTFYLDHLL